MKSIIFLSMVLSLTLYGCVHQSLTPVISNANLYQQQLSKLTHWQLEGKIGVRHASTSDSAAVQWQQHADQFDIFLSGPLGAGATRLIGTPRQLIIQNGHEEKTSTSDPQKLIEKHLGWTLPLEKLPQWIVGYNTSTNARFNGDNTLANFIEHDWQVEYQRYQTVDHWLLPEKIVLTHEDMQVTIIIKHWTID